MTIISVHELARSLRARRVKRLEKAAPGFKMAFDDLPRAIQYEYEVTAQDAMELLGIETGEEEPADYSAIEARIVENMTTIPEIEPGPKAPWPKSARAERTPTLTPVKLQSVLEQLANGHRAMLNDMRLMAGADIRCGDMLGVDKRGMVVPYKVKDEDDECGDQTISSDKV